jgi:hypothetical protein
MFMAAMEIVCLPGTPTLPRVGFDLEHVITQGLSFLMCKAVVVIVTYPLLCCTVSQAPPGLVCCWLGVRGCVSG